MSTSPAASRKPSLVTIVSIALVAYAACDMIHEVLGHGLACLLMPDVSALSLSTVALQTSRESRWVAAAGSIANVLVGVLLLVLLRRRTRLDSLGYFLWLLATLDLLNGTGYLFFSGLTNTGDWSVVIAGLEPTLVWRIGMSIAGAITYARAVTASASVLSSWVSAGELDPGDAVRLCIPAYIAGGLLLLFGSAMNPIGVNLIWLSGMSSGFGAMAGLLAVPRIVERRTVGATPVADTGGALRANLAWAAAAVVTSLVFVLVLGRGIPLVSK